MACHSILVACRLAMTTQAQSVGLKTNFLYWGAWGSPNGAVEVALGNKVSADIYGGATLEVWQWIATHATGWYSPRRATGFATLSMDTSSVYMGTVGSTISEGGTSR